jgi:hypothetical protein
MGTRVKICGLLVAAFVCALLVAAASRDTNAYFTDVHAGKMTGTFGTWVTACPYRLAPGCSKAEFWNVGGCITSSRPIAQYDCTKSLYLDFGDMWQGSCQSWCDVLRITSLAKTSQTVSLSVSGPLARHVTSVGLAGCTSSLLKAGATQNIWFSISVPNSLAPGVYTGMLTIHVAGWSPDAQVPMTLTVCKKQAHKSSGGCSSGGSQTRPGQTTPTARPSVRLSPASPTPAASSIPAASPTPTPAASGSSAPAPSCSPSAAPTSGASSG